MESVQKKKGLLYSSSNTAPPASIDHPFFATTKQKRRICKEPFKLETDHMCEAKAGPSLKTQRAQNQPHKQAVPAPRRQGTQVSQAGDLPGRGIEIDILLLRV